MPINVNINNQNKHWILVIVEKIGLVLKNFLCGISRVSMICIKAIGKFFKKIWKPLLGLVVIGAIIASCIGCFYYYKDTYKPNKLLNDAIADIENKLANGMETIYAYAILRKDYEWGYKNVVDSIISNKLSKHYSEAFEYIESKAYEGSAKHQYILGQIYSFAGEYYHYASKDKTKAAYWWNEAVKQNYITAYNNLANAYMYGTGVKQNERKAIEYYRKGAEGGCDWAQRNYGDLFMNGVEVKVGSHKEKITYTKHCTGYLKSDEVDITEWNYKSLGYKRYWDSTQQDYVYYRYEEVDDYKVILHKDIEKAKYWWRKAAAQGNEVAKERLQKIYE